MASMVSSLPLALCLHRLHRLRPQPVTHQLVQLQAARRAAVRRPAKTRGTGMKALIEEFSHIFFHHKVDSNFCLQIGSMYLAALAALPLVLVSTDFSLARPPSGSQPNTVTGPLLPRVRANVQEDGAFREPNMPLPSLVKLLGQIFHSDLV